MQKNDGMYFSTERMPIAMAYVPWQHFGRTYDLDHALSVGTIFPDLDKPFTGRGGNC
ncbi:MAG: spore coat associated protein CotJA [Clostridiales bacterium]|nr:spore coat associated protein CotJA [Clostridiales bacterium]